MKFRLEINCDNEAFATDCDSEVARILRDLAKHVERGDGFPVGEGERRLHDSNGNHVGHALFVLEV